MASVLPMLAAGLIALTPACEAAAPATAAQAAESPKLAAARAAFAEAVRQYGPDDFKVLPSEVVLQGELVREQRLEEALPHMRHIRERLRARLGPDHESVKTVTRWIALSLSALGRSEESAAETASLDTAAPADAKAQAEILMARAIAASGAGRYGEAETTIRQALSLAQQAYGPDHATTRRIGTILASIVALQGRAAEAGSLDRAHAGGGADDPRAIWRLARSGALSEARDQAAQLLARRRADPASRGAALSEAVTLLADIEARLDHRLLADPLFREALEEIRARAGPESLEALNALESYALNRAQLAEPAAASEGRRQMQELLDQRRKRLGRDHPVTLDTANAAAGLLSAAGQSGQALVLWRDTAGAPDALPAGERLEQVLLARRALGGELLAQGDAAGAYPYLRSVGRTIQRQVLDRRITGGQEGARQRLLEYRDVWLGQIRAGWDLAHSGS